MRGRYTVIAASLPVVAAMSWLALAGAGSFAESKPNADSTCSANGTALSMTASDNKYDKDCLAVPANQASIIAFDNEDRGIPHNVSIYQDDTASKALFKGEVIEGPKKITYNVPALPEGRYYFRCDPHPEFMYGAFISGNPPPPATTTTTAPPPTTTTTSGIGLPKGLPIQPPGR
ncbi:MAG TPA: cupredoxin domain-containing protein [Acidimicrobiia bacterium]|nr:cupredoxin domain-containing protein [Acidimicrobiia bacterium]